jgi:hypothetical protein
MENRKMNSSAFAKASTGKTADKRMEPMSNVG